MANDTPETRLDDARVQKIAKLSRLKLTDADVHRYAEQLTSVLGYVAQLNEVNVEGVEPLAHPLMLTNVLREDQAKTPLPVDAALANAPGRDGPYFTVPKVLDTGMGGG